MISTKGRYALRIMIDLAEHGGGEYIPLKAVAQRQEISLKYIERIMPLLTGAGLVEGAHGKGGGYRLTRSPEDYTALAILTAAEGELVPVACLEPGASACHRAADCRTLAVWRDYYKLTVDYFGAITLASLTGTDNAQDYVI